MSAKAEGIKAEAIERWFAQAGIRFRDVEQEKADRREAFRLAEIEYQKYLRRKRRGGAA